MDAGHALHLDIRTAVAVRNAIILGHAVGFVSVFLVLFVASFGRRGSRVFGARLGNGSRRSSPSWYLPDNSSKALQCEATLGPSAARLARTVEGAKACVDGSLVGLGAEFVSSRASRCTAVVDSTVLPIWGSLISILFTESRLLKRKKKKKEKRAY